MTRYIFRMFSPNTNFFTYLGTVFHIFKYKHSAVSLSAINKNLLPLHHIQEDSPIPWHNPLYLCSDWLHTLPHICCFWPHSFPHNHSITPSSSSSTLQLLQHKYITHKAELSSNVRCGCYQVRMIKVSMLRSLSLWLQKENVEYALVSSRWSAAIQWLTWKVKHERTSCLSLYYTHIEQVSPGFLWWNNII